MVVARDGNQHEEGQPLVAFKLEWEHSKEGMYPPYRVQTGTMWRGGGLPRLIVSKLEREHKEEGMYPPRCVEMGMTRRGVEMETLCVVVLLT